MFVDIFLNGLVDWSNKRGSVGHWHLVWSPNLCVSAAD